MVFINFTLFKKFLFLLFPSMSDRIEWNFDLHQYARSKPSTRYSVPYDPKINGTILPFRTLPTNPHGGVGGEVFTLCLHYDLDTIGRLLVLRCSDSRLFRLYTSYSHVSPSRTRNYCNTFMT